VCVCAYVCRYFDRASAVPGGTMIKYNNNMT